MTTTLLTTAYQAVDDKKGEDIVVLNMEGVSLIADQFIICHANSERQVQAIAKEVADKAAEAGYTVKRLEGVEIGRNGCLLTLAMLSYMSSIVMSVATIISKSFGETLLCLI